MLHPMREKNTQIPLRLPPLNALRVFEAAARHGSFVQAAQELHVTHGAVSRQVRQLEEHLGLALFERRNRAVFLTRQGQALAAACAHALGQLGAAVQQLRTPPQHEPLVLSCEPTIAMRWLIPRLPAFHARFPLHQLHLLTAGGPVDFTRDRVDVALRRNDFPWSAALHAATVAPEWTGPVCTPALARHWMPRPSLPPSPPPPTPLHTRSRPHAWAQWQAASGVAPPVAAPQWLEHFYLCLQAAISGLGVTVASAYMVEDDVRSARLAAPHGFVRDGSAYVLLSPSPWEEDPRRTALLQWLRDTMAQTRTALGLSDSGEGTASNAPGARGA